jgi:amino acid permease
MRLCHDSREITDSADFAVVSCVLLNVVAVKFYGEAEFIMASTKVRSFHPVHLLGVAFGGHHEVPASADTH